MTGWNYPINRQICWIKYCSFPQSYLDMNVNIINEWYQRVKFANACIKLKSPPWTECDKRSFLRRVGLIWIQIFLLHRQFYLLIYSKGREDGFMSFPRVLTRSETQIAASKIWTRIADSILMTITETISVPFPNFTNLRLTTTMWYNNYFTVFQRLFSKKKKKKKLGKSQVLFAWRFKSDTDFIRCCDVRITRSI